jgi:cell division protease FtsH
VKHGVTIELIWALAGHQAGLSNHHLIEQEHLLIALLQFCELDLEELQQGFVHSGGESYNDLLAGQQELKHFWQEKGLSIPEGTKRIRSKLTKGLGDGGFLRRQDGTRLRSEAARYVCQRAREIASVAGQSTWQSLHLAAALLEKPQGLIALVLDEVGLPERNLYQQKFQLSVTADLKESAGSIGTLVNCMRSLREVLLQKIFGQDHSVQAFVEGLYNAELTAAIDRERKKPAAIFVFAGPPGVGKTYLAELSARFLGRPFKRFDMTGYSDHQAHNQLIGFARSYQGAHSGLLTGFVAKNPNAILLFDEIEKAHPNTIQLFYQILDAGRLEDKYTEEDISLRDNIIIFTTNAGRSLYDQPNRAGFSMADAAYHRRTILSALELEKNPANGEPAFPPALCSRLGQGYPLMFNHLGINELIQIASAELEHSGVLFFRQYRLAFNFDSHLPLSLVLRAGGLVDARQVRSETERFIKEELFKYASLYKPEKTEDVFSSVDQVNFILELPEIKKDRAVWQLFNLQDKPQVLLIADPFFADACRRQVGGVQWFEAQTREDAAAILAESEIDMVLLNLFLPDGEKSETIAPSFDHIPYAARVLTRGRDILRKIRRSFPEIPVYLLLIDAEQLQEGDQSLVNRPVMTVRETYMIDASKIWANPVEPADRQEIGLRTAADDELFWACLRSGGARGLIKTTFNGRDLNNELQKAERNHFEKMLTEVASRIYWQKQALDLARKRQVLFFDTVAKRNRQDGVLTVKLRDFRLGTAIEAADAGELIDAFQRPLAGFEAVSGAETAKGVLQFIVDWLNNPGYYAATGVKAPRGFLLTGPSGSGKTFLARTVAAEANCAFLEKTATAFIGGWPGSGPHNVRHLFEQASRYAPSIIFIDEIDAIGARRGSSGNRFEEDTLVAIITEMDSFYSSHRSEVIVLAATSRIEVLDEGLLRRFDRIIEIERPDRAARLQYLKRTFPRERGSRVSMVFLEHLAGQSAGMTIADLERVIQAAAIIAAQRHSPLHDKLLEEAFDQIRLGDTVKQQDLAILERTARHEAGHAIITWLGGEVPCQLTIIGRGTATGYMEKEAIEGPIILTKPKILQRIREMLGGRAAEMLFYGEEEGLSNGAADDLKRASSWALRMVQEYGMDSTFGLFNPSVADRYLRGNIGCSDRAARAAGKIMNQELLIARSSLEENIESLGKLAQALLDQNRLVGKDIETILGKRQ